MDYFEEVLSTISHDELTILNELYVSDSFTAYTALTNSHLKECSSLSEATYRKVISNLIRLQFIKQHTGSKNHTYYISQYGSLAINRISEGVNEVC